MNINGIFPSSILLVVVGIFASTNVLAQDKPEKTKPIRALLIAGGCCHDYPNQIQIITEGISQRANVKWEVFHGFDTRNRQLAIYQTDNWTDGFDVIVHNECYGAVDDVEFVERIVRGHAVRGVPLVAIHCSMHSYRNAKTDAWRELLGVTSVRHEKGGTKLDVVNRSAEHPIMKKFPASWQTPNGELYVIEKSWPNCVPMATAYGKGTKQDQIVMWTNEYKKAKVFGTTLGHHNETMLTDEWLDVVSRGLLWSCQKLDDDGNPMKGYEGSGKSPILLPNEMMQRKNEKAPEPTPAKRPKTIKVS